MIGAGCVARDFHTIVPWPLERRGLRVGDSSRRSDEIVKNLELRL